MQAWEVRAADGAAYLALDLGEAERWAGRVGGEARLVELGESEAESLLLARQYTNVVVRSHAPWIGRAEESEDTMSMENTETVIEVAPEATGALPMNKPILAVHWQKPDGSSPGFSLHLTEEQAHTYVVWRKKGFPRDTAGPLQVAFTHEVLYADVQDASKRPGNPGLMVPTSLDFVARPPTSTTPAGEGAAAQVSLANERARVAALPPTAAPVPAAVDPAAVAPARPSPRPEPLPAAERTLPLPVEPEGGPIVAGPLEVPAPAAVATRVLTGDAGQGGGRTLWEAARDDGLPRPLPRPALPPGSLAPLPETTPAAPPAAPPAAQAPAAPKVPPKGAVIQAPGVVVRARYVVEVEAVLVKGNDGVERVFFSCPCCDSAMQVTPRKRQRAKAEEPRQQDIPGTDGGAS